MTSQVLNFLWLNLELPPPPDPANGSIREPLPAKYIENVRKAGEMHPQAEIDLWVDSKRLTERQIAYIKASLEEGMPNVHLKDLRSIHAYDQEPLFNFGETDPYWRTHGQTALIWCQVDTAKILVCLQGKHDQTFFADLDHAHLDIEGPQVQSMLKNHGMLIGSYSPIDAAIENQLWGFKPERRSFFEEYYGMALKSAYKGDNAFHDLEDKAHQDLEYREKIAPGEFCLFINEDGTQAKQPGSEFFDGFNRKAKIATIPRKELGKLFKESVDGAYADLSISAGKAFLHRLTAFEHKARSKLAAVAP